MIALLASVLLVAYIVVPGVLFRLSFSTFLPLRAFDRTRTQEIGYAVIVCLIPFAVAVFLVWHVPLVGRHPFGFVDTWQQRDLDYKAVLLSSFSDQLAVSREELWAALTRSSRRQLRLVFWYYPLVVLEALAFGALARGYPRLQTSFRGRRALEWLARKLVLRNISEWHVLLTDFLYPGATIQADVLTGEDRLYRGDILDYTLDKEGSLAGLYLQNAERFDRPGYLKKKDAGLAPKAEEYWRQIPGKKLFLFADKIFTLNIRPQAGVEAMKQLIQRQFPDAKVTVEPARSAEDPAGV